MRSYSYMADNNQCSCHLFFVDDITHTFGSAEAAVTMPGNLVGRIRCEDVRIIERFVNDR